LILIHPPNPTYPTSPITKVRFEDTKYQKNGCTNTNDTIAESHRIIVLALKVLKTTFQLQKRGCVAHSWVNLIGKAFVSIVRKQGL
jgi:hypothetical protein